MTVNTKYTSKGIRNIARLFSCWGVLSVLLFRTPRYSATELRNISKLAIIQFIGYVKKSFFTNMLLELEEKCRYKKLGSVREGVRTKFQFYSFA